MKKYLLLTLMALPLCSFAQISFTTLTSGTTQNLLGISFADTSIGYACGDNGTIIKTTNGGSSWTTLTTGTTKNLWDIKVIPNSGGQKVIAVGDSNAVLKTVNGGATWTQQSIPFQVGSFVFGVQCFDSLNYFACGGDFATTSGAILKTTNGGTAWTKTAVPNSIFLDKIFMVNSTDGFTVGTNTSFSDGAIHKITGSSFSPVKTNANIITNVWCNSATNITAVGVAGQIWKSTNGGSTWTSQSFNTTDLYGIRFIDSLKGFACGGSSSANVILTTSNGGTTWTQIPYSFNGILQSISITGNKIFIAGAQGRVIKATLPTGIKDDVQKAVLSVYPNPANDVLFIDNPLYTQNVAFRLRDISGRVVLDSKLEQGTNRISIAGCKGMYFYDLIADGAAIQSGKIVTGN